MKHLLPKLNYLVVFFAMVFSVQAFSQSAGFNSTFLVLDINNSGNVYFDLQASTGNPDFDGANLGTFCISNVTGLIFKGAEHNVYKCGGCDLSATRLFYRIYLTASEPGAFTENNIGYSSGFTNGCGGADQNWTELGYSTNLLSGLSAGNYTLEVYSDAIVNCSGGIVYASNSGNNYKATFNVNDYVTYYYDSDGDGFGSNSSISSCIGAPANYVANNADCNDNQLQYQDTDGDGFGSNTQVACGVVNNSDCNDNQFQYLDSDGDGFGSGYLVACGVLNNSDCNDNQIQYLDADADGFGSNTQVACGVVDNSDCNDNQFQYLDADDDGFGSGYLVACGVLNNSDCNDNQIQYLDFDGDSFGSNTQVACGVVNNSDCNDNQFQYLDSDGDGFGSGYLVACGVLNNSDCNDNQIQYLDFDGDSFGSSVQVACGVVNNSDCNDNQFQYLDADGDGFGSGYLVACGVFNNSDCNDNQLQYLDADGDSFGSTTQVACGVTNNIDCDDNQLQYLDSDGDGFGSGYLVACGVTNNSDCNDNQIQYLDFDGDSFGSSTQVACGVTHNIDCDDNQLQYLDSDGDGFGSGYLVACGVTNNSDCNDNQIQYLDFDGDSFGSSTQVACGVVNNSDCNDGQFQYLDSDGDGFGSGYLVACGVINNIDCNDNVVFYEDLDNDAYGSNVKLACGSITNNTDCDDSTDQLYQSSLLYIDMDNDGFDSGTEQICYGATLPPNRISTTLGADCDDNNENVNPDAVEILSNGLDDDCDGMTDAYPFCSTPTTWDGNSWSNGYPVADQPVIFTADYTVTADMQACTLTITNQAEVNVNAGFDLRITGMVTVDVDSDLILESNANLVQTDNVTNVGTITIKRQTTMRRLDYTFWSSPVDGQNLFDFSPMTSTTPTSRFYTMNESTNSFVPVVAATTDFEGAKGFMIRAPNDFPSTPTPFTGIFTGTPQNGNISIAITNSGFGFNIIGNPYPSPLNANLFLATNPGTLYFWTHTTQNANGASNYAVYNNLGGTRAGTGGQIPNGTIQTGQGFLLQTAAAGNASFNNTMRVGNNQNQFFRTSEERHRYWLNLSYQGELQNQILIGYIDGATNGTDVSIDGKLIENSGNYISSRIENTDFSIQGRALPFENYDEVLMNFKANEAGTYTISLDSFDGLFENGQAIFLKDNLTGTVYDIKQESYSFASVAGTFTNRFSVIYQNVTLGTPEFTANQLSVYTNDNKIQVVSKNTDLKSVRIFDIRGRLLSEVNSITAKSVEIPKAGDAQQVLIVQVTDQNNTIVTKKVVF